MQQIVFLFTLQREFSQNSISTTVKHVKKLYSLLIRHMLSSTSSTKTDAKLDTVFGLNFYILSILLESLMLGNSNSIIGRIALRTIVECYITLSYLKKKNSENLYQEYRVFGAGQAKLSSLKIR